MDEGSEPRIRVTDGPYVVEGRLPVVRTSIVRTDHGEPIGWAPDQPVEPREGVKLCRCGH